MLLLLQILRIPKKNFQKLEFGVQLVGLSVFIFITGFVVAQTVLGFFGIPILGWITGVESGIQSTNIPLKKS